jgi:hypothetical protein
MSNQKYDRWTTADDYELLRLHADNRSVGYIAEQLDKSETSIKIRLTYFVRCGGRRAMLARLKDRMEQERLDVIRPRDHVYTTSMKSVQAAMAVSERDNDATNTLKHLTQGPRQKASRRGELPWGGLPEFQPTSLDLVLAGLAHEINGVPHEQTLVFILQWRRMKWIQRTHPRTTSGDYEGRDYYPCEERGRLPMAHHNGKLLG